MGLLLFRENSGIDLDTAIILCIVGVAYMIFHFTVLDTIYHSLKMEMFHQITKYLKLFHHQIYQHYHDL